MNMDQKSAFSPPSETITASPNSPPADLLARLGRLAEKSQETTRDFGAEFFSMYRSIFPPKSCSTPSPLPSTLSLTPSTRSSSSSAGGCGGDEGEISATEHRLNQARLILERQQLSDHYDLCQKQLHSLNKEIDFLRRDNAELRTVNAELLRILSSPAALRSFLLNPANASSFGLDNVVGGGGTTTTGITASLSPDLSNTSDEISDISPTSVIEPNRFERRSNSVDRVSLPKSISVRSTGYQKTAIVNQSPGREGPSRSSSNRPRSVPSQLVPGTQRVYVPGVSGEKDEEENPGGTGGLELEVYNQGMFKTELCNKWQQTGACPYGDHCQFAHGITELRPVIRHPRYKTEICRMVLSGDRCPYGHRCHFRHSLTEEERLLLPR